MAAQWWGDFLTHFASPYDCNPLNINPLRDHLLETVDFAKVRACEELQLFIAATNVRTGKIKVFERHELTADHVMASACLPYLFQAVEIDGEFYWDGGLWEIRLYFPYFIRPHAKTPSLSKSIRSSGASCRARRMRFKTG